MQRPLLRAPSAALIFSIMLAPAVFAQQPAKPTLVVFITVDQMRGDYLVRYESQFKGGLKRLTHDGVLFTSAFHDHAITETAPGHATVMSGRFPVHTGIAANTAGVADPKSPLIGSADPGASPWRFKGTTLLDWMRANDRNTRFLSVSRKDRGAILPVGSNKGDVYWYASDGNFTTSKYYANALPQWVSDFNAKGLAAAYKGWQWIPVLPDTAYAEADSVPVESQGQEYAFPHFVPEAPAAAVRALGNYPVMDELTLKFALAGVQQLQLGGTPNRTDLLAVSLSTLSATAMGPTARSCTIRSCISTSTSAIFSTRCLPFVIRRASSSRSRAITACRRFRTCNRARRPTRTRASSTSSQRGERSSHAWPR
jgi:hypothetical protein